MSTEYLEKNTRSLKVCCTVLRVAGWLLMVGGVLIFAQYLTMVDLSSRFIRYMTLPKFVTSHLYPGILAIGLGQFITYIFDSKYQPGWLLRRADKIVYLYAVLYLLGGLLHYFFILGVARAEPLWWPHVLTLPLLVAKIVILVGLGRLLRLVMPVIEESRTLV